MFVIVCFIANISTQLFFLFVALFEHFVFGGKLFKGHSTVP